MHGCTAVRVCWANGRGGTATIAGGGADRGCDPERRVEVLAGELVEKAAPSWEHSDAQGAVAELLRPRFCSGRGDAGGWWILLEPDISFGPDDLCRPDAAGWRRERVPQTPSSSPISLRPDWICEILSPSTARRASPALTRSS